MEQERANLYGDFVSLTLRLDKAAFAEVVNDWPPGKVAELRAVIRQRFGDEQFTTPSIQHAASVIHDWPLDQHIQKVLIDLGNAELTSRDEVNTCLQAIRTHYWYLMAAYPDMHFSCLDALPPAEGAALIHGLASAEEHGYSRYGGSVSLVCPAFHLFRRFGLPAWTALADRIIASTTNPYIPFNFRRTRAQWESCRTRYQEPEDIWACVCTSEAARTHAKQEKQQADKEAVVTRRLARRQQHVARMETGKQSNDLRDAILAELQPLSPVERLERIVKDTAHPVTFYPTEYALLDAESAKTLSLSLRRAVIDRLSDRRRGPWRKLSDKLKEGA